ncbi:hypothetical protein HY612_01600 [Candidatus Roizmanbacteria bacterium]|nr:hypothetical protein [Candidatus Roizmanbacteria bacterium]
MDPTAESRSIADLVRSPRDLLTAMASWKDGRLQLFDGKLAAQYREFCRAVESAQPEGEFLCVADRGPDFEESLNYGEISGAISAIAEDPKNPDKYRIALGGRRYDLERVLAGLWAGRIFGGNWGGRQRHASPDMGFYYLHPPVAGVRSDFQVTKIVIRSGLAPMLAKTIENFLGITK